VSSAIDLLAVALGHHTTPHSLLLCKRVLEIAAVPTRREQEAAE